MEKLKRIKDNKKLNPIIIWSFIISICAILLTFGFSAFQTSLDLSGRVIARIQRDIRVTNISSPTTNQGSYSNWEDYNVDSISASVVLPNQNSTITYDVTITNIGNTEMGILDITGLPNNLDYTISNYNLKDPLCDDNNSSLCMLGAVTTLQITISYKNNGFDSSNITYNLDMNFDFKEVYSITYIGFSNLTNLPTTILDGETKNITFTNTTGIPANALVTNAISTYTRPTLTISDATSDITITRQFSITYVDFTGNTSGLRSVVGPEGGTIAFTSTTGTPDYVLVTGATSSYDNTTHILTLTSVTSDVVVTVTNNGTVEIISITRQAVSNITENNSPQITNNGQNITFDLGVTVNNSNYNDDFYITYAIVIENDSVFEQKVLATNFNPTIIGTGNAPSVTYTITDANNNQVLNTIIPPKTTETYYLTINVIPEAEGTWGIEGSSGVDAVENGTVTGEITGNTQGDLTGSNTRAHFTTSVANSYETAKSFTFTINDNKFRITDSNGNDLSSMTIQANTIDTFDFYIENINGNNFISSPYDLNININSDNKESSIGVVSLLVDIDPTISDVTPPVISNVTATITSAEKEILVSWVGTDDNTISNYYVETYTSNASGNGTLYHTETLSGGPNGTQMTYTATVPNDNAYYYFKVYAKDQSDNIASSSDIASCSTSQGYCSSSANEIFKWNFTVTLVLTNATSSNGTTSTNGNTRTVTFNAFYDSNINTTLDGSGNNYDPPSSISSATITYPDGSTNNLPSGSSTQTAYAYNTNSHVLNVYHIKGDIRIEASGVQTNTCLAEGTKILLANGTYKNIEDIKYDDLLAVWNYDTGKITYEYPLWIEKAHTADELTRVTFDDDSYIDFVGNHAIYSTDKNLFVNILDKDNFHIGTHVAKLQNNTLKSISVKNIEIIHKKVKYYFVGSTTYYNIFANNVLTTDRNILISNLYGFDNYATWPKEKQAILQNKNNLLDYSYFEDILPYYLYKGFRVREAGFLVNNNIISLNEFKKYITNLIINPKMLESPITINNERYWMVTSNIDIVNDNNKKDFLRKEGSVYTLPNINKKDFLGWYNTSDNTIYKPGDKLTISHGTYLEAVYNYNHFYGINRYNNSRIIFGKSLYFN